MEDPAGHAATLNANVYAGQYRRRSQPSSHHRPFPVKGGQKKIDATKNQTGVYFFIAGRSLHP